MGADPVSEIQRDYLLQLAKDGKRFDGRAADQYRDIELEIGLIKQSEGSCRVKLGDTDLIVGISMGEGTPYSDKPDEGTLITTAELKPMASPDFETGPPSPKAIEIARVIDRGIRETGTIDMKELCIEEGAKIWMAFVDIHVLDFDGNLFDAGFLGALAALRTGYIPWSNIDRGDDQPMPITQSPIMTTAVKIGGSLFWDPVRLEEKVCEPMLTVATDESGDIRAMQKSQAGGLTRDEVKTIIKKSRVKASELRGIVDQAIKEYESR